MMCLERLGKKRTESSFLGVVLLLALLIFSSSAVNAQEKNVVLTGQETTLEELIKKINAQTGYIFGINNSITDIGSKVSVAAGSATTSSVLSDALGQIGQTYSMVDNYILISPLTASPDPKPTPDQKTTPDRKVSSVTPGNKPFVLRESELRNVPVALAAAPAPVPTPAPAPVSTTTATPAPSAGAAAKSTPAVPATRVVETYTPNHIPQPVVVYTPQRPASGSDYDGGLLDKYIRPRMGIKTNLLYGFGTLTPNLSLELGLGNKTTLELGGSYNPWNLNGSENNNNKLVHWIVGAEGRYWFCERFNGHFVGLNAFVSQYNISGHNVPFLFEKAYRYEGNAYSVGASYGYHWMWSQHWGMEFNVGVGIVVLDYDKYDCERCASLVGKYGKSVFMPTRAGISLVYLIK